VYEQLTPSAVASLLTVVPPWVMRHVPGVESVLVNIEHAAPDVERLSTPVYGPLKSMACSVSR